jgi:hypothetical protein
MPQHEEKTRRGFLISALSAALGAVSAAAARAQHALETEGRLTTKGQILRTEVSLGDPPREPLDTMIHFRRSDDNRERAITHQILSLSHEEKGSHSYPWTVYAHLGTHHEVGDACVLCSRLHKYGPGWSSGLHSEVFNHNRAVSIGVNVEMGNDYTGKEPTQIIGVNVQAVGPLPADHGIQIHDGNGRFRKGLGIEGSCDVAIELRGKHRVGLDMGGCQLRLGDGGEIALDGKGEVLMRYRDGSVEFLRGGRVCARIPLASEDAES